MSEPKLSPNPMDSPKVGNVYYLKNTDEILLCVGPCWCFEIDGQTLTMYSEWKKYLVYIGEF